MATRMQQRRGTAAEWTTINPILAAGEIGFETDTGKFRIGDGTNTWDSLVTYGSIDAIIDAAPATLDTLNELAAAINDDPDFYANITQTITDTTTQLNANIASSRVDIETAFAAADANEVINRDAAIVTAISDAGVARDAAIASAVGIETTARGIAIADSAATVTTAYLAADATLQTAVEAYADTVSSAAQTAAEGTAALDATSKADAAQAAAEATAATALTTHNNDTTNVHGIADTSALATTSDVSTAQTAAQTYADGLASNYDAVGSASAAQTAAEGHADGVVASHNAATTSVHGIADTSDLALLSAATQTFSGDMVVTGDLTVSGTTTTIDTANFQTTDPLIYLGEGNVGNAADLGFVANFNDGTYQHTGLARDASDNTWKLFVGITDEPTSTLNFAQGTLDDLAVNNLTAAGVTFSDGTQTLAGVPSITTISEKTASYTLSSAAERDTLIEVNSASATTLTIPADDGLNFPVGTTLDVLQTGAGQVTIAGAVGVTVNATPGLKLRTQWSSVTLLKRGANLWVVYGDTAA